ncbi:HIR complex subunit [Exophiala xenobiotica]|uniref:Protein HIR n=1 Tax=Lithohypha guttulata TaxID=1690604 RepID=A0ABR0K5X7_9EURO|nr:HIR complex subunit [Lithohypha guttulata]KAK5315164.1 HIR complex subunit [Exophiala xenobiotica]
MRIVKPVWLAHPGEKKDHEIYSCHISPDGERLVTGAGDGYVRIWSTEAIYNATDATYDKPKQLASMSYHSGTIHTVRFSPGGKFLASGADDRIVCIYNHDPTPPPQATFGSSESPPVENWRLFRRLIGHENDVQDLGWSYDGTILVSVGLDSKVVVWSGFTFEKLKTLTSHLSHVKGITFDPANKYFATASDDRSIRIFRFTSPSQNTTATDSVNNFMLETTIVQPFVSSPLTTYFRRCSWGPDGAHIAAANAVNGPVSAIAIIERGTWAGETTLIGHEAPVEVCAFSPRLYSQLKPGQSPPAGHPDQHTTVIACGGADKSLSIWTTSSPRPLVVAADAVNKSITDIAWNPSGDAVFVSSADGTIVVVGFEPGELGYAKDVTENDRSLSKFGTSRKGMGFPETTDALLLEEMSKAGEQKQLEGRMGALMGDSSQPATNGVPATINGTSTEKQVNGVATPKPDATDKNDKDQEKLERLKNRVEITKDGKKRIKPLLISSSGGAESSLPQTRLVNASAAGVAADEAPKSILDLSKPFDGLPKGGIQALLLGTKRKFAEMEGEEEGYTQKVIDAASQNGRVPIVEHAADGLVPAATRPAKTGQEPTPEWIRPAVLNPALTTSQVRLSVPKIRTHVVAGYDHSGKPTDVSSEPLRNKADYVFEARNAPAASLTGRAQDREPCRITLTRKNQPMWQDFLPRNVLLITGNEEFWAAADETGSIFLWTPFGRRLNSAIVMEAQPVVLECYDSWLLCINSVGMCYVWNVKTLTSPHPPVSVAPVLDAAVYSLAAHPTGAPAITNARLNSEGRIIITLSNGEGYAYAPQMYCWQRLSEVWWAVGSQYWNTTDSGVVDVMSSKKKDGEKVNPAAGILPWMERRTTTETLLRGRAYFLQRLIKVLLSREGYESFESSVSIAHLENRIAGALMLGSKDEFKLYLLMYAKRLGAEGLRLKAEELLRTLVGGIVDTDDPSAQSLAAKKNVIEGRSWEDESGLVCGWDRKELLKDVVMLLGKHRDMQRVTVPYARYLGVLDKETLNGGSNDADAMAS